MSGLSSQVSLPTKAPPREPIFLPVNKLGRINLASQWTFDGHRSGWPTILDKLSTLHNPKGVMFDGFIEQNFGWHRVEASEHGDIPYVTPWIGMMHNPPNMPEFFDYHASPQVILRSSFMQESLPYCRGLYVFSQYHKEWLDDKVPCPVEVLTHPTEATDVLFDWECFEASHKSIVQVGYWLRRMHAIQHLDVRGYRKVWIVPHEYAKRVRAAEANAIDIFDESGLRCVGDYEEWDYISDPDYDDLLSRSIVFAHLYDASANNAILECIVRNTPILVTKLPGIVEYLGEAYPLYFESLDEAARKAADLELVKDAHLYLKEMDKQRFEPDFFVKSVENSEIYGGIELWNNAVLMKSRTPKIDRLSDLNIVHGKPISTDFAFVISFRNQGKKIRRCLRSLARQFEGKHRAGVILIDDDSEDDALKTAMHYLDQLHIPYVAVRNHDRKYYTRNLFNAVYFLVEKDDTVIVELDGDDYLEDTDVLTRLEREYSKGALKTFGSFRMSPGSRDFPGFDLISSHELVTDLSNPWNLDYCFPWMHLKSYKRKLFREVPLVYFWERGRDDWLKTAEDLSSHAMMMSIAGAAVRYIKDILYVYDFTGLHHELNQVDRPRYVLENLYRVPAGSFIGRYWAQVREENAGHRKVDDLGPRIQDIAACSVPAARAQGEDK